MTPGGSAPVRSTRIVSGTRSHSSPVAQSAAISLRPMPAPNAPSQPKCVVWLSAPRISLAGQDQRLFADHLVADAAARLEEVRDALLRDEAAHLGVVLRVLGRRRRDGVVERDRQPLGVTHTRLRRGSRKARAMARGVVVAQRDVGPGVDDLAGRDVRAARRPGPAPSRQRCSSVSYRVVTEVHVQRKCASPLRPMVAVAPVAQQVVDVVQGQRALVGQRP